MEPDGLLTVRDLLVSHMRPPICFLDVIMHGVNGFSFIFTSDDTYVRLNLANDFDAHQSRDSESWFRLQQQPALERELKRCIKLACMEHPASADRLEITGSFDTFSIDIRSVTVREC